MRIERLHPDRWVELQKALDGCRSDEQLPKPENSVILGAFDGDEVIGCIGAQKVWWVTPVWVKREQRGIGLARELALKLGEYNVEGFDEMCMTTNPHVDQLVFSLGFIPIRGRMWRRDERG